MNGDMIKAVNNEEREVNPLTCEILNKNFILGENDKKVYEKNKNAIK